MKNKSIIWIVLVILLNVFINSVISAEIDLVSYNPQPAQSGDSVLIQLSIKNKDSVDHQEMTLQLIPKDDLFATSEIQKTFSINSQETKIITFQLGVKSNADSGSQDFEIKYKEDNFSSYKSEKFSITVANPKDILIIKGTKTNPEIVEPGKRFTLDLELENIGEIDVNDVLIKLDLSQNLPFAPYDSGTQKIIEEIRDKEKQKISFELTSLQDSEVKIYKIPITLQYRDDFGDSYTKSDIISIEVGADPFVVISVDGINIIENEITEVPIRIINPSLSNAKFMMIEVLSGNYEIISGKMHYIGDVESDDFETFETKLMFKRSTDINLKISYKNINNEEIIELISVPVKVYTLDEAKKLGLVTENKTGLYLFLIVLLIILFVVYRKIKKARRIKRNSKIK